jgi:phosphotransferase system enzyme I (PtsI)
MKTERKRKPRREIVLSGIGVSAGVAIGPVHRIEGGGLDVAVYRISARRVAGEQDRFAEAVTAARDEVADLAERAESLPRATRDELVFLLEAHLQMLSGSRLVRGVHQRIGDKRINAEAAVKAELTAIADAFSDMEDPYLAARAQDVREVAGRLVRHLVKAPDNIFANLPDGAVLIAEELTPADIALLDPGRVAGFATELGGPQGHTAIMARSLGLPAVLGVPGLLGRVKSGQTTIVDGDRGALTVMPKPSTLAAARRSRARMLRSRRSLAKMHALPAVTRDGSAVALQANLELPGEVAGALDAGAQGVGLLRTEFLYMNRDTPPDADEQYEILAGIVDAMDGRPVTVRTLDVGGDKLAYSLEEETAGDVGANPALGLRAIRLSLRHPHLLQAQFEAMLRVGAHGPIRILLPMITTAEEVRKSRAALRRAARRLIRQGVAIADPLPPLGAMIEIPAAALSADRLIADCDFLSIGTNDLTMYALAVDRGDDHVADLYDPLHPAVLRLIQFTAEAAARAGKPVNLCGEIAGEARFTALLLGFGFTDLSMSANSLPAVKRRVRQLDLGRARDLAEATMNLPDARRIAALIDDFNEIS